MRARKDFQMQTDDHARSQVQRIVSPSSDAGFDWWYSDEPRPCACGNRELTVVETVPQMMRSPRRVAIRCPNCGAIGEDTCHGTTHAARRWNWHGDQRHEANDPKLSHGRAWRGGCAVGGKVAAEAADVTCTPVGCSAWLGDSFRLEKSPEPLEQTLVTLG